MKKESKFDWVFILIWPIIAVVLSFLFKANTFSSVILFLVIPSIYLSIRGKRYIKNIAIFSILPTLLLIIIDYIAHVSETWIIPNSILSFRLFQFVSLELILWAYFMSYFIIIFYEYFLDHHVTRNIWKPRMRFFTLAVLGLLILFSIFYFTNPSILNIPYFYLVFGIILMVIPILLQMFNYPKVFSKFALTAAYFFVFTFMYEIAGLRLGWWAFPGTEFIGWVHIFGVSFPLEEFVFWFMLTAFAALSYYEFFEDDEK